MSFLNIVFLGHVMQVKNHVPALNLTVNVGSGVHS